MTSVVSRTTPISTVEQFEHGINRVVASLDGRFVAISDVDMNVTVLEGETKAFGINLGSPSEKIRPTERIRGLAFSSDAHFLYAAAGDRVYAFHTHGWSQAWTYEAPRSFGFLIISPVALDVAENGDVAAAFDNGMIVVWDAYGFQKQLIKDNDSPRWLRFCAGGSKLVGSDSFGISTWEVGPPKRKVKIPLRERAFGMDANRAGTFAAIRDLKEVSLWDIVNKTKVFSKSVLPGIPLVAFHPEQDWLAYGEKNRVRVVDFSGNLLMELELDVASALSIGFSSDGSEMLIGCTKFELLRTSLVDLFVSS